MRFRVTFTENNARFHGTFTRECDVPSREDVIKIYGLNEPDILDYKIEEI